jgi:hypothetical protein
MKQVSRILDTVKEEQRDFIDVATSSGLLDRSEANQLANLQQQSGENIRSLAVECGLLSARQSEVLFSHFQRSGSRTVEMKQRKPQVKAPTKPKTAPAQAPAAQQPEAAPRMAPSPKFKQHPIITIEEVRQ